MNTQRFTSNSFQPEHPAIKKLLAALNNPWKMAFFFWKSLPSLLFWRLRVEKITPFEGQVSIPMSWQTQNPFKSIYFGAQAGAAEISTGLLALVAIENRGPISMLVSKVEGDFLKKATGRVTFTCTEGQKILDAIQLAIDTGEGQTARVFTKGIQQDNGQVVSQFYFTWSFKVKEAKKF